MRKTFIQICAVAKVVAKEALTQPISAWPSIRDLNLPLKKRVQFVFNEKDYDASFSVIYNLCDFDGVLIYVFWWEIGCCCKPKQKIRLFY